MPNTNDQTKLENPNSKLDFPPPQPGSADLACEVYGSKSSGSANLKARPADLESEVRATPATAASHPAAGLGATLSRQQLSFLMRVAPAALASERAYQIPAAVTIAQAILESATPQLGRGSTPAFRLANNPFGTRDSGLGTRNPGFGMADFGSGELNREFADALPESRVPSPGSHRFPNLTEAFHAHARLLRSPRYRPAYEVRHDWKQFVERLGPKTHERDLLHCGYSTNPSYSALLTNLIGAYRLDDRRLLGWLETGKDPGPGPRDTGARDTRTQETDFGIRRVSC